MALRKRPIATGIATLLFSGYLSALGLGEIKLNSSLNEPLDAEIPLLSLGELTEEEIIAGLASNADFANSGVDKEIVLTTLMFNLDLAARGGPTLRITSKRPIREPYLDFLVDVQWPAGRLLREYTLLLDLPVYAGGSTSKKKIEQPAVQQRSNASGQQVANQSRSSSGNTASRSAINVMAGDEDYVVGQGETLWGIASRLNTNASMNDRMDAVFQLNPDAFIRGDKNLLKRGAVLRLPDYGASHDQLSRGSYSNNESSDYSPELSAAARGGRTSSQSTSDGRLTLEAGGELGSGRSSVGSGSGNLSGVRGEIVEIQEELDKSQRENSELRQRLASLEDQMSTMQRLIEIGDDDLRAVQLSEPLDESPISDEEVNGSSGLDDDSIDLAEDAGDLEIDSPALALFPSANSTNKPKVLGADFDDFDSSDGLPESTADDSADGLGQTGESLDNEAEGAASTSAPDAEGGVDSAPESITTTTPMNTELKTEKGWLDQVNGFLLAVLGIFVVLIGAIAVFVLRKRKSAEEEYRPSAKAYSPPPAAVRERVREEVVVEPQAASIDDIDLKDGDDLFAQRDEDLEPIGAADTSEVVTDTVEEVELDLSEFDLDEEDSKESLVFEESEAVPVGSADDLNLDEEFDFLGDVDEGDTQLELAQAYMEMGDQAGAKEILQEVADGGNDEQKVKARKMLDQLG